MIPYLVEKLCFYFFFVVRELDVKDVAWLAKQLGNLRGFYEIDDPLFNHWDFLWSANVNELLNYHLIQLLLSHR